MKHLTLALALGLLASSASAQVPNIPPPLPEGLSAIDGLKVKRLVDSLAKGDEAKAMKRWGKLMARRGEVLGEAGRKQLAKHVAIAASLVPLSEVTDAALMWQTLIETAKASHRETHGTSRPPPTNPRPPLGTQGTRSPTGALTEAEKQMAHRRARELIQAIEMGDLSDFTRGLSRKFSQDRAILENALRDEQRNQSNVQIQIFPNRVQARGDTVTFSFTWNRQASDIRSGASDGTRGSATFFMSRKDGMKVTRMNGPLPFGVRDRDLVQQAGGGPAKDIHTGRPVKLGDDFGGQGGAGSHGGGYGGGGYGP